MITNLQGKRHVTKHAYSTLVTEYCLCICLTGTQGKDPVLTCQGNDTTEGQNWHEEDGEAQCLDR